MCGNRVEELESRVKELEASITGLTDELIECKVRMRELEDAADVDLEYPDPSTAEAVEQSEAGGEAEEAEATKPSASEEEDSTEEVESDIIVA